MGSSKKGKYLGSMDKFKNESHDKISETLINFALPLLELVDEETSQRQLTHAFMLVVTVWNAVVESEVNKDSSYLDELRTPLVKEDFGDYALSMVEALISRKKELYPNDLRMISDYSLKYDAGELHVEAVATSIEG